MHFMELFQIFEFNYNNYDNIFIGDSHFNTDMLAIVGDMTDLPAIKV